MMAACVEMWAGSILVQVQASTALDQIKAADSYPHRTNLARRVRLARVRRAVSSTLKTVCTW